MCVCVGGGGGVGNTCSHSTVDYYSNATPGKYMCISKIYIQMHVHVVLLQVQYHK